MLLKGRLAMICGMTYSVPTITEANCLRIGLALGNNFFNATVKCLALLLHSTETKSNCCQGNGREDSGREGVQGAGAGHHASEAEYAASGSQEALEE